MSIVLTAFDLAGLILSCVKGKGGPAESKGKVEGSLTW